MGVTVVGVDGGNSKTEVVVASGEGELLSFLRGPGSNSHALGSEGCIDVVASLVPGGDVDVAALFLCGADLPHDIAELEAAARTRLPARRTIVDNDTFAVLRAGTDAADAVAVVCGSGINCVGRAAGGRVARDPSLGWESGDWGGADMLAREALFLAARGADGRGEPTALTRLLPAHFDVQTIDELGAAFHYRRLPGARIGELARVVLAAAEDGDALARSLVERLADEIALMVRRALADLALREADVVLGGGMLARGDGILHDEVVARLPSGARPIVLRDPPVLGAALAALDAAGAPSAAAERLREAVRAG